MTEQTTETAETVLNDTAASETTTSETTANEAPTEGEKPEAEAKPEGDKPEGDKEPAPDAKGDDTEQTAEDLNIEFAPPRAWISSRTQYAEFSGMAKEFFKENPNATAQEALKWAADKQAERVVQEGQNMIQEHNTRIDGWLNEAKADKEIGGDKFDANIATAKKALETWGSKELAKQLDQTGLGNHPDLLKFLVRAGKALQSGDVLGPGGPGGKKNFTDALYGQKAS
jgi:hypothetical protein